VPAAQKTNRILEILEKGGEPKMTPMTRILVIVDRFRRREDGQGLAEYALILALIAIVAIVALLFLGSQISDKLSVVGSTLESVAN
jgi:pilus assembly protein Flp/PilA